MEQRLMPVVSGFEMDAVYMYYDEPRVIDRLDEFRKIRPDIAMLEGVKGINNCHAAACDAVDTEYFILIDGDNAPLPTCASYGPLSEGWLLHGMAPDVNVVGYCAQNSVTGYVSAHGGIKIVRKAARDWFLGLEISDYCMTSGWQTAPSGVALSVEYVNLTPFHAFRSAYKEVTRLLRNPADTTSLLRSWSDVSRLNQRAIWHWAVLGADVPYGIDSLGGATSALVDWANWAYADEELPAINWLQFVAGLEGIYKEWAEGWSKTSCIGYSIERFFSLTKAEFSPLSAADSKQVRTHLLGML